MAVTITMKYTKADGTIPPTIEEWVATLPQAKQDEFAAATIRETAAVQAAHNGALQSTTGNTQQWQDAESFNKFNVQATHDPVWFSYWNEYLTVNNIIFEQVASGG